MNNDRNKKIKSQKNVAILLIIVPMIILLSYLGKADFDKYRINNYAICGALLVLIGCGAMGLKNSIHKQGSSLIQLLFVYSRYGFTSNKAGFV